MRWTNLWGVAGGEESRWVLGGSSMIVRVSSFVTPWFWSFEDGEPRDCLCIAAEREEKERKKERESLYVLVSSCEVSLMILIFIYFDIVSIFYCKIYSRGLTWSILRRILCLFSMNELYLLVLFRCFPYISLFSSLSLLLYALFCFLFFFPSVRFYVIDYGTPTVCVLFVQQAYCLAACSSWVGCGLG